MAAPTLYASPTSRAGSLASFQPARTPASAYACEQRLLTAYTKLLYCPTTDVEQLMRLIWGELTPIQMYGYACKQGRIDRLDDDIPNLIRQLHPEEQPGLCELLLGESPDLPNAIRYILALERRLLQREDDPRLLINDELLAKAAGLGKISSQNYGALHASFPKRAASRTTISAQVEPTADCLANGRVITPTEHPLPPCQLRPKPRTLHAQVKKAQERKRLKRKRRR